MTDCNECLNKDKHSWDCKHADHYDVMWDDDPTVDGESCPDSITRDDAREQAGCEKLHEFYENGE